jgi:hypothetical protein
VDADRRGAVVLDGHLALAVGPEPGDRPVLAQLGEPVDDPVRQGDRQGHQLGRLVGGVAEHQALVAGADVLALAASASTPWAMSGDCLPRATITAQVVASKPISLEV